MSDLYAPPPGPPPSFQFRQTGANVHDAAQHHVHWQSQGQSSEQASYDQTHSAHMSTLQGRPQFEAVSLPSYAFSHSLPLDEKETTSSEKGAAASFVKKAPPQSADSDDAPPPYDPWMAIPDNALLPPPPTFQEDRSPGANASADDAARAHAWIRRNPLWRPRRHDPSTSTRIVHGDVRLTLPPNTRSMSIHQQSIGRTHVRTSQQCTDSILLSDIPLYIAQTGQPKTVYYEVKITSMSSRHNDTDCGIAIGFVAPPYPAWRLPGWHRGSLGLHGDDGRRYIDNSLGGQAFTSPFRDGEIVGIGMSFNPPAYSGGRNRCDVFFTRNGKRDGGWDLHEERDAEQPEGDVTGLEGDHDLLAAVGCFGPVEFETRFRREEWLFRP